MNIYGVYLLDNDRITLASIKKSALWRENNFRVIGSGTDPDAAAREIAALRPALVIYEWETGGIMLMKKLRAAGADCEFILLTYCQSFAAVRSFYTNGGLDYLLKPFNTQDAERALLRFHTKNLN
ncbi:MAG: hypothetical protein FWB91_12825 [Defluviitaleaceae bacterium]|nr:hypothetical protein [Defluviitaleaceae bacterium]